MSTVERLLERYRFLLTYYDVENNLAHQRIAALLLFNTFLIYGVLYTPRDGTIDRWTAWFLAAIGILVNAVFALAGYRTETAFSLWSSMIQKTEGDINEALTKESFRQGGDAVFEVFSIERIRREHYRWRGGTAEAFKLRFGPYLDIESPSAADRLKRKAGLYHRWPWTWAPSVLTFYLVQLPALSAVLWFALLVRILAPRILALLAPR